MSTVFVFFCERVKLFSRNFQIFLAQLWIYEVNPSENGKIQHKINFQPSEQSLEYADNINWRG